MTTIQCLIQRYADGRNAPLSTAELAAYYGNKWASDNAQWAEFERHFVICRDQVVRIRGIIQQIQDAAKAIG